MRLQRNLHVVSNKSNSKLRTHNRFALSAITLCLVSASELVVAQQSPNSETEVIEVRSVRQAYQGDFAVSEIPQVQLDISGETISDANALNLVTALDLSASVARQNNFGGLWNSFAIRGFSGDENLPSNYLVNGFNAGRGFAGPRDISGIERIEILKGPKAALFGRGEPGGVVNLVTKRPTFEPSNQVNLSMGSWNKFRADGDFDVSVSKDLGVRLVGFYEDAESFRDTVETKRYGFFPSVAHYLNDETRLVYELELSRQEIPFDRGVPAINNVLGDIPIENYFGEPGNGPMISEVVGHQIEMQHDIDDVWSALIGFNFRDTSLEGLSSEPTLSSGRQFLFRDGESLSRERRSRAYDAEYYVLRGEITGEFETGSVRHRVIFGADYDNFETDFVQRRIRGGSIQDGELPTDPDVAERLQVINVFNPVYGRFALPSITEDNSATLADRIDTAKSLGFFVQDQISLTEKLDIRIGLRYDDFSQERENRANGTFIENDESRISPQFGVVYKLTDEYSLYASYGEGFRPLLGTEPSGEPLDPNITTSMEAGVKFEIMDGNLQGTATIFQIEQENILAVTPAFEPTAVGEAESEGFEFDLNGRLSDTLDIWVSYAYVDVSTNNDFFDANFGVTIPAGTPLVNVPEHQFTLQLAKEINDFRVGGGLLYVGERSGQLGDYFGQGEFMLPSYTTIRAFAEYSVTEDLTVRLDVDNLTDKEYYVNSFASLWVEPGTPRNVMASVSYNF